MAVLGYRSFSLPSVNLVRDRNWSQRGPGITITSGVVDSSNGLARTSILRPGFVVVKRASTGEYLDTTDANGDRDTVASATSLANIGSGAANKTFKFKYKGGVEHTITTATATTSVSALVTLLNADDKFNSDLIADAVSSTLRIRSKRAGADEYFEITDGTLNGQGGVAQDTFANNTFAVGAFADYRVVGFEGRSDPEFSEYADMLSEYAVAQGNCNVQNLWKAYFVEASLIGLTTQAKACFIRRGSIFA